MGDDGSVTRQPASLDDTPPDYLLQSDEALLRQCRVETFRASGPGGQKRNKTDSAVRLRHEPSGLTAQAFESRSQHENRSRALLRLRQAIAVGVRRQVTLDGYQPPPELKAILPAAKRQRIGPKHRDYWLGVQALLDLFVALDGGVAGTAAALGLSTGALSRLIVGDPRLLRAVNRLRQERGLRPLH